MNNITNQTTSDSIYKVLLNIWENKFNRSNQADHVLYRLELIINQLNLLLKLRMDAVN